MITLTSSPEFTDFLRASMLRAVNENVVVSIKVSNRKLTYRHLEKTRSRLDLGGKVRLVVPDKPGEIWLVPVDLEVT